MLQRMGMALQGSLLDTADHLELRELAAGLQRTVLTRGAWVDYRPGWLAGADELFDLLHRTCRGAPSAGRCTSAWSTSRGC